MKKAVAIAIKSKYQATITQLEKKADKLTLENQGLRKQLYKQLLED